MIAAHKGEVPFAIYILPFSAGIAFGLYFPQVYFISLIIPFCILLSCFILLNVFYSRLKVYNLRWIGGVLIHLQLFLVGWIAVFHQDTRNKPDYFALKKANYLLVKINNEPKQSGNFIHFTGETELAIKGEQRDAVSGSLILTVRTDTIHHFAYGDELLIPAKIAEVEPPYNPGEFNYKQYLAHQQIYYQSFLIASQCVLVKSNAGNPLIAYSLKLRQKLVEKFSGNMHSHEAIAVASTLILGYKADLSPDVLQAYSDTGTIHVLSVSGAHVAIIFVFISFAFSFLNKYRYGKYFKAIISILLIWFYAMLTGFSPAVCRAAVMISFVITGKTFSRYINTVNILAISAFILLLYNPLLITDVGFQLSYLAVAGLVVFQPVIYEQFEFKQRWKNKLWYYISASLAAQLITFPLSAFYFHQFPVYFLISNLFIILPSEIIMFTGLIYLMMPKIPLLSNVLGYLLEHAILWMDKGFAVIEKAPIANIRQIWISGADCIIVVTAIVVLFYFVYTRRALLLRLGLLCILLVCMDLSYNRINEADNDSITFLNLRKHLGVLFKKDDQAVLITDLQPTDKTFVYSIKPCLDSNRISVISCIRPDSNFKNNWFCKRAGFIQFEDKRMVLMDKTFSPNSPVSIKADYVFLTNNPHINLKHINGYGFSKLILNGDSREALTQTIKRQADSLHIDFVSLKRNKALELFSK